MDLESPENERKGKYLVYRQGAACISVLLLDESVNSDGRLFLTEYSESLPESFGIDGLCFYHVFIYIYT